MTEKNCYKNFEHPFAQYVRILGKGQKGSRSLTLDEAFDAFTLILNGEVLDVQLGAFLMLLRVKEESAEELTGFVKATKHMLATRIDTLTPTTCDFDWSSYAGKKKQLPWFLFSIFLLVENGYSVLLHGESGHTFNRLYTQDLFKALNLPIAYSWEEVPKHLASTHFCYFPLEHLCPPLSHIIQLRNILGLRSPVHTLARLINPLNAQYSMQGIFHPNYRPVHQEACRQLGFKRIAVIKGEGGECERNPAADTLVQQVINGVFKDETWPRMLAERAMAAEQLSISDFTAVWQGKQENHYAELATVGTLSIALKLIYPTWHQEQATQTASNWWEKRNKSFL